jgi:RibD C-terminal domain
MGLSDQPPVVRDFAEIWRAAGKVVYSRTLETVSRARTRIERDFDPEAIRQMKAAAERDISMGGPDLAAQALEAGLVDECHLLVAPVLVGGGKRSLPHGVHLKLELLDQRRFGNGMASSSWPLGDSGGLLCHRGSAVVEGDHRVAGHPLQLAVRFGAGGASGVGEQQHQRQQAGDFGILGEGEADDPRRRELVWK